MRFFGGKGVFNFNAFLTTIALPLFLYSYISQIFAKSWENLWFLAMRIFSEALPVALQVPPFYSVDFSKSGGDNMVPTVHIIFTRHISYDVNFFRYCRVVFPQDTFNICSYILHKSTKGAKIFVMKTACSKIVYCL